MLVAGYGAIFLLSRLRLNSELIENFENAPRLLLHLSTQVRRYLPDKLECKCGRRSG